MRVTLIHNPGAGDDDQPDGKALEQLLRTHGHTVRYQAASQKTWAAALDEPADLVVVAGGDGTVGRVAKKLIGRNIALAPLPLGTANNISKTLSLADRALDDIVVGWKDGRQINFDVGIANGPWGSRYFVEALGIGLFARAIPAADESKKLARLKDADAKVAHALGMLRDRLDHAPAHALELALDGKLLSGEFVLLEAMNMEFVGPNLYLAPNVDPTDGLLDVVVVTKEERDKLHESLADWQEGDLRHPDLTRYRASHIEFEWTGFEVHMDDEIWPLPDAEAEPPSLTHIDVKAEREGLKFLVPTAE